MNRFLFNKILGLFVKTNGIISEPIFRGQGHIFMLHRVLPEKLRAQYTLNKDLAITPEHLEWCILFFKKKGYEFISLNEVHEKLTKGEKFKRKFVALTLDDGYRDNLEYGLPVFKKHQVPVTIYVTNCFPNGTAILWWYLIEERLKNSKELKLTASKSIEVFSWRNDEEAVRLFPFIRNKIKNLDRDEFTETIKKSFDVSEDYLQATCKAHSLTWEEIRQLSKENLVTIGAHTLNHISLANQKAEIVFEEMINSKSEIENYIQQAVNHFAYPYGGFEDAHKREYAIAKQIGFKTAVLNHPGNIFYGSKYFTECLPRMPLGNITTEERLDYIINGIDHYRNNGFHRIVKY